MAYNANEPYDTEADLAILRQRCYASSASSVFHNNNNGTKPYPGHDDNRTYHGQTCCGCSSCRVRNIATPVNFYTTGNIDAFEWIKDYEEIARANKWGPQDRPDIISAYLKGTANSWY